MAKLLCDQYYMASPDLEIQEVSGESRGTHSPWGQEVGGDPRGIAIEPGGKVSCLWGAGVGREQPRARSFLRKLSQGGWPFTGSRAQPGLWLISDLPAEIDEVTRKWLS